MFALLSRKLIHIYFVTDNDVTIYGGADVPFGNSDFQEIVNYGFSFVDKTLLIKDIIENTTSVSLVVRPRRFGKTTNLSMLRYYFSIPVHPDNKKHQHELFKGSKIETQNQELFKQHFCKYPVIYLSLKVWH